MPRALQMYGVGLGADAGSIIDKLIARGKAREVGVSATLPTGVPELTAEQARNLFDPSLLRQWWFWAIAGTVVAGGAVFVIRSRRRRKSK